MKQSALAIFRAIAEVAPSRGRGLKHIGRECDWLMGRSPLHGGVD